MRKVLSVTGEDRVDFLQNLVTNDVTQGAPVYAALLTPQGKYLADFVVIPQDEALLIDVAQAQAEALLQRLNMYRLRARVEITPSDWIVTRGLGKPPAGAIADPRHEALGWRHYGPAGSAPAPAPVDWDALRVAHLVPEAGIELIANDSYILEMDFERLHGVDFRKGCYVGQEVTARMKHKTELKKGLRRVAIAAPVPVGRAIVTADGRPAGTIYTQSGGQGIAYLRFDRIGPGLTAEGQAVTLS